MVREAVDTSERDRYAKHLLDVGTQMALSVENRIASAFQDIPQVETVYISTSDTHTMSVSIFVNEADQQVYRQTYCREIELERASREISFDFSVIARHNRPMREFVGSESPTWERCAHVA